MQAKTPKTQVARRSDKFRKNALAVALAAVVPFSGLQAQEVEEVIVTGVIRDSIRNSIELKRESSTIVDAISSTDIGALPDLSVAETLERITGVTADRFKGGASEISIRGLGPFLVASTYNGREVSSGSGNRTVAFSQFPSELVNRAVVYKAQQASLTEGGVAGTINLSSIRPIDYGKRRFQTELKGSYNDYAAKIKDDNGLGYRFSLSFTDTWDVGGDGAALGFAIGYARTDEDTPEESYNTSSVLRPCNSNRPDDGGSDCSFSEDNAVVDPAGSEPLESPYYFTPNSRLYRSMATEQTRDALLATVQFQPNDDWDITGDLQWSNRYYSEDRHDLYFDDGRRRIGDWLAFPNGALRVFNGESRIGNYGEYRERDETYTGGGINVEWQANDRLILTADLSISDTVRDQDTYQVRLRSPRQYYQWEFSEDDFPTINWIRAGATDGAIVESSTLDELEFYSDDARARFRRLKVEDTISAIRLNAEYDLNSDYFPTLLAGFRYSSHDHNAYAEDEFADPTGDDRTAALSACAIENISEDYGSDTPLANASYNITSWAQFDTLCGFNAILAANNPGETVDATLDPTTPSNADVILTEDVVSAFAQVNFEVDAGQIPVSGNFGVRVVQTETTSTGYLGQGYQLSRSGAGTPDDPFLYDLVAASSANESRVLTHSYVNVLPSVNVNFGLRDDVQLRAAAYQGISRPDMWWLGSGRDLTVGDGEDSVDFTNTADAVSALRLVALGNVRAEAIESSNFDLSLEWYPTEESQVSTAIYYKKFSAAFGTQTGITEDATVSVVDSTAGDAVLQTDTYSLAVESLPVVTEEESDLFGIEIALQHTFTYLPAPWDGLGFVAGMNYAETTFETPENGEFIPEDVEDAIAPGALPGFSRRSYNTEVYWERDRFSARVSYKYRSRYLKPFNNNFEQTNRYVLPHGGLNAAASFDITDDITLKFQALDIMNNPYIEERVVGGAYNKVEYNGRRFFVGVKYRM